MTTFILSRSPEFSEGYAAGSLLLAPVKHLARTEPERITAEDRVIILGGWDTGMTRAERVAVEKVLHDSGARILNGAGHRYDWGFLKPWEHDGDVPGSAVAPRLDMRPHSRACGIHQHDHGVMCHRNCPTCGGK